MVWLVPVTPAPLGHLAAFRVLDDEGAAINLDVDDLELYALVDGVAADARLDDDELTLTVDVDPGPVGQLVYLAAASTVLEFEFDGRLVFDLAAHPFGSTIAGVEALVANITVNYASSPGTGDVARWLDELGAVVTGRLGVLDGIPDAIRTNLTARAAAALHLGAGAYLEDAAHPDRVSSQGDDRYGAVLWARFEAAVDSLAGDADEARLTAGVITAPVHKAAASFPAPLFRRDRPI